MAQHNDLGAKGEALAISHLKQNGYAIVERNWRFKKAEIDIIAQKDNILVMVEVKTRSSNYFGDPQEFLRPKQKQLLIQAIDYYVTNKNLDVEVRFDIIAILKNKNETTINHLEDAFYHF